MVDIPDLHLIEDVIVGDRLHLIDLGMMKRLLNGWRDGSLGLQTKMSLFDIQYISNILKNTQLPSEIHRKMRALECLAHWKGSELSSFLHYAGIVALKEFLNEDAYNHFLLLFTSITMLSSNTYRAHWHVARKMLEEFISDYIDIYGSQFITSNVHNLQHIVDETIKFGPLNTISAYPFENALYRMKNMIRNGYKSLEQITKRLSELHFYEHYIEPEASKFPRIHSYRKKKTILLKGGFALNTNFRDCWFLTKDKEIVKFISAVDFPNFVLKGKVIKSQVDYFTYPIKSSSLNIFQADENVFFEGYKPFELTQIMCKLAAIKNTDNTHCVFIPLLHTLH